MCGSIIRAFQLPLIGEENPIIDMNIHQQLQQMYPPLQLPQNLLEETVVAYTKPKRFYHTIEHVLEVLKQFQLVNIDKQWKNPQEVYLAIVFHDAIYEYGAKDNEQQSAIFAQHCSTFKTTNSAHGHSVEYTAH